MCIGGALRASVMFAQAAADTPVRHRPTTAHFLSEIVATLGLIVVIFALARSAPARPSTGRSGKAPKAMAA